MKKLLLTAAVCFALVSCGDDDNDTTANVAVEGQWKLTSITLDDAYDLNNDDAESTNLASETGCFNNSTITFGNGIAVFDMQDVDISYEITGTGTNITVDCIDDEVGPLNYTVDGSQVVLGSGEDQFAMQRSGNTLSVHFDQGTTVPVVSAGGATYVDVGTTFVFTKQ